MAELTPLIDGASSDTGSVPDSIRDGTTVSDGSGATFYDGQACSRPESGDLRTRHNAQLSRSGGCRALVKAMCG